MKIALVVLAAGKGTRMKSARPKVLHEVGHAPLLHHAMASGSGLSPARVIVVAGHGFDAVAAAARAYAPECDVVRQAQQRGTGHAVDMARAALADFKGTVVVLYGDTPLITEGALQRLVDALQSASVAVLGFKAADPARYGRLVTKGPSLERIVEYKDTTAEERAITLCNSGVMAADKDLLFDLIATLGDNNAQNEVYLTDVIAAARARDLPCAVVTCDEDETLGVDSRMGLARAEAIFQHRMRHAAMEAGVTLQAPETVYFSHDTQLAPDTWVAPHVVFGPGVTVEGPCTIHAYSHLEDCRLAEGCSIGPYARVRPGTTLGAGVRIGNFVETKNAAVAAGAKINHLSYIGDAAVGPRTNIGAGTITCNYDGVMKHKTQIGADAFIGSGTMLVAPVTIGDTAMTASGSVITRDVAGGDLALARAKQVNKPSLAVRLIDRLRAIKAAKKGS